jgi:predicted hotdog family 3-hydroxylacyl-ACP dehydratase
LSSELVVVTTERTTLFLPDPHSLSMKTMPCPPLHEFTVEDLLPHRGPMLLAKEVLAVDRQRARVSFTVSRSWPLAEPDGVDPLILLELAAQTAGICNGWQRIQTLGRESDAMGWLVGIKRAELGIPILPYDRQVLIEAETTHFYGSLREVDCLARMAGQIIGQLTLQVFQAESQ